MSLMNRDLPLRIVAARERLGLTQKALSEVSGVALSTLNEIECGWTRDVRLSTLLKLSGALGASLDDLLGVGRGNL